MAFHRSTSVKCHFSRLSNRIPNMRYLFHKIIPTGKTGNGPTAIDSKKPTQNWDFVSRSRRSRVSPLCGISRLIDSLCGSPPVGILKYVEDLKRGTNAEIYPPLEDLSYRRIGPKDYLEIAFSLFCSNYSNTLFWIYETC